MVHSRFAFLKKPSPLVTSLHCIEKFVSVFLRLAILHLEFAVTRMGDSHGKVVKRLKDHCSTVSFRIISLILCHGP